MNILTLSIKQKYFDEILAGTKKTETREVRPNNFKRYCRYLYEGIEYINIDEIPGDDPVGIIPLKYDALKLITGAYNLPKRPYMIVEVEDAETFDIVDEDGNNRIYEVDGKEYAMVDIDYHLGKILEVELYK